MTCRTLEDFYGIDGHTFERQYKETLSNFREWDQSEHADKWLLFPDNMGPRLAIDESSLSNGELYTFVTNRDARTREQSLIAVVSGTKSEDVIAILRGGLTKSGVMRWRKLRLTCPTPCIRSCVRHSPTPTVS